MVCTSKDANIFQCADAALKTAVSNVQRDVTELRTDVSELKAYSRHCNETGELSEMIKSNFSQPHTSSSVQHTSKVVPRLNVYELC